MFYLVSKFTIFNTTHIIEAPLLTGTLGVGTGGWTIPDAGPKYEIRKTYT